MAMRMPSLSSHEDTLPAPKDSLPSCVNPVRDSCPSSPLPSHNDAFQNSQQPTTSSTLTSPQSHLESEEKGEEKEPDHVYPGWKIIIPVMLALYIIMFLVALDGTIIATAIPKITNQFHSVDDVGWYGSIYMMMRCSFVLVYGKIYSFYNPKWVLITAVVWFEIGSILCGAAPNSLVLIIGRALAGVGAAGIFTGAIVAVTYMFPLEKRPIVMGLLGLTFTLSTVLGPLIGGVLTDNLSWRWCFYINLPLGGAGLFMLIFLLKLPSPTASDGSMTLKQQFLKLDPLGFIMFVPSIICLLLALEWGGSKYAWSDPKMIVLLILFAFLFVSFVATQLWLQEEGTVPPRIARQRSIACALWFALTTGGIVTTVAYYLPLWFQAVKGTSATESGISVLPNAIANMFGSLLSGVMTSRVGYYVPFMISGPILMGIGSGLLTTSSPTTASGNQILYQIIYGLGSGGSGQQVSVAAQTVLNDKDVAIGAALMMFGQFLGSAIFVSVGQNVFATRLSQDLKKIPGLDYQKVLNAGATDLKSFLSGSTLKDVLNAYSKSITGIFFVAMGLACAALLGSAGMEWKSVKKNKNKKSADDGKKKDPETGEERIVNGNGEGIQTAAEASEHSIVNANEEGGLKEAKNE